LAWLIQRGCLTSTLNLFSLLVITGVVLVARIDAGVTQAGLPLGTGPIRTDMSWCVLYTVVRCRCNQGQTPRALLQHLHPIDEAGIRFRTGFPGSLMVRHF
jgi:hypothetical protein